MFIYIVVFPGTFQEPRRASIRPRQEVENVVPGFPEPIESIYKDWVSVTLQSASFGLLFPNSNHLRVLRVWFGLVLYFLFAPVQRGRARHAPVRICSPHALMLRALRHKQQQQPTGAPKHEGRSV